MMQVSVGTQFDVGDLLPAGEGGRRSRPDEGSQSLSFCNNRNPSPGYFVATFSLWERVANGADI